MVVDRSRTWPLLAALGLALALSGCVSALNDLKEDVTDRVAGEEPPRPDEVFAWEDFVGPGFEAAYEFPVDDGVRNVTATVALTMRSALPTDAAPNAAQVTVFLQDANGDAVSENVTLDPRTPNATLQASHVNATGTWSLIASGDGLAGNEQGAKFNATLVVVYNAAEPSVK